MELAISGDFVISMGDPGGRDASRFFDIEAVVLTCLHIAMGTAHNDGHYAPRWRLLHVTATGTATSHYL